MQKNIFIGNLAQLERLSDNAGVVIVRFTLISNEYAGKDKETGEARERAVAVQFTAFGSKGDVIAKTALKGDQLIVDYRIENNNYKKNEEMVYKYNFIVEDFVFGAPGKEKREQFRQADEKS